MKPGTYPAIIPIRYLTYTPDEYERWLGLWRAWDDCKRRNWSVWAEFEPIARSPRFNFTTHLGGGSFAEARAALDLTNQGYQCWQANMCRLFQKSNTMGIAKEQTDIVEGMLAAAGHPHLRDYKKRLQSKPRDPDITAYHPVHGWRFTEVKWKNERMREGQLETLGFLQHAVKAQVEVVRVVPEVKSKTFYHCTFVLT